MEYIIKTEIKEVSVLDDSAIQIMLNVEAASLAVNLYKIAGHGLFYSINTAISDVKCIKNECALYPKFKKVKELVEVSLLTRFGNSTCYCIRKDGKLHSTHIYDTENDEYFADYYELVRHFNSDRITTDKLAFNEALKEINAKEKKK